MHPPPIRNNSTDPFSASATRIEASYHTLLQYFIQVSHPRTWHAEIKARGIYTFQQSAVDLVANCVQSTMSMFTMLASMASQMQYFEGVAGPLDTTILIHKALTACRQHIARGPIDTRLIFGIHSLANAEFYRFNVEAARTHVCAVKAFVDQAGGLATLPQYLREWFVAGDEFIAAETHQKPLFAASEIDPGPWPGTQSLLVNASGRPMMFRKRGWNEMPTSLKRIIDDIRDCVNLSREQAHAAPGYAQNHPLTFGHWLHLKAYSIRNRLLSLDIKELPYEALRLAVLAWCYMTKTVTGRRRTMQVIASRLRGVLTSAQEGCMGHDSHLWLTAVGALASENSGVTRNWFVLELIKLNEGDVASPGRGLTEKALIRILSGFLYCESAQLSMVRLLATDITNAR